VLRDFSRRNYCRPLRQLRVQLQNQKLNLYRNLLLKLNQNQNYQVLWGLRFNHRAMSMATATVAARAKEASLQSQKDLAPLA
jgi:hypothetical protein